MRTKGKSQELERVRLIAANMFDREKSTGEIVDALGVDDQTVRAWRRTFRKFGREGLKARPHPGAPPRMTRDQLQELARMLLKEPAHYGFDKHLWTTRLIRELIRKHFGVSYHADYVGTLLHDLGFSCQKPCRRAKERDEVRIDKWRREEWPALVKKKRRGTPSSSPTKPGS
jgi:transposase